MIALFRKALPRKPKADIQADAMAEALASHAIALQAYREALNRGDTRKAHETHAALKKAQALRLKVGC